MTVYTLELEDKSNIFLSYLRPSCGLGYALSTDLLVQRLCYIRVQHMSMVFLPYGFEDAWTGWMIPRTVYRNEDI